MNLTSKQKIILALIVCGDTDGPIDLDQLLVRLPYITTKQSMQFSIRALMARGLIEKGDQELRRDRSRRIYMPTALGLHWAALLCPKPVPVTIEEALDVGDLLKIEKELGLA